MQHTRISWEELFVAQQASLKTKTCRNFGIIILQNTRWSSNHKSRLLSQSNTFVIIVISDLTLYQNLNHRSLTLDDLWPQVCWGHMWLLLKDHCVQVSRKYIKVCGYSDPLFKNLNQRSLTSRWPLTPSLLRSHVWLYPRIIVSKSHDNTWKCVDTASDL